MRFFKASSITKKTLNIYWSYTLRYKRYFIIASGGAALAVITQAMVPPYIVSLIFSKLQFLYASHQDIKFSMFTGYFAWFAISMLTGMVLWRLQSYYVWKLEEEIRRDLANDIYDHLQAQSYRFHAERFGGAIVSQTTKFGSAYERLMDDFIWSVIPGIITIAVAIIVLAFISWPYALILLVISIVYLTLMSKRVIKQMPYNAALAQRESEQTAALADAITNMSTVRAFAGENHESARFRQYSERQYQALHKLTVESLKTDALSHVQTNGFQTLTLLAALIAVTGYGIKVSLLYLVISYTGRITDRLWEFSRLVRNTNRALGDAVEMTKILGIEPEVKDPVAPKKSHIHRGEVRFNNVSFSYPENKDDSLFKGLDLKIKPGEKVGLVGPSGGGKTTITKLILRFMDVGSGSITIDGQDISKLRQADLRAHISYVAQEPVLFHRTLAENIAYADPGADQKVIVGVAKMAHAHEFIEKLPKGYETLVGERGVKLSGGQRQRVAIARAMLKNAPILVLDEATSALDSESELLIQDALWKLMENRTAVVIAHRLSTIQKMDRIIVMDEGKVVEEGSHKDLLRKNGVYAKLWAHQSGGFIDEDEEDVQ